MLIFSNSLSIIGLQFFETLSISFNFAFLRDHKGNKAYKLLFLCKSYHQLSAIKDIVSFSLVFYY